MKKLLLAAVAATLVGLTLAPVFAADDTEKDQDKKFVIDGMVRGRFDYFNNYTDLTDGKQSGDPNDDSASLYPYRAMVGITGYFTRNVSAHVDLQYNGFFGDEFSPQKDVFPPLGQWTTPYQFNTQGVQLYTGYIDLAKIGGSDFGVRIGRAEHTYGTELFLGDNDYYAGLSFDGVRGMWQHGHNDLNFFYYKIAEDNFFGGGANAGANDSNLFGATYDWHFNNGWGTVGGEVLVVQDMNGNGPIFAPDSKLMTYGLRWNKPMNVGKGVDMFDWNIEGAFQSGDAFGPAAPALKTDLSGDVEEGWFGWNFGSDKNHGRVHVGGFRASGDDPNTTDKNENFNPLYGDYHANNRLGDLDFVGSLVGPANVTDINAGYEHWIGNHMFMIAGHFMTFTEKGLLPDSSIGTEVDLKYGYRYSKNVSFEVGIGELMAGKGLEALAGVTTSDAVQRGTAQVKLSW
jgi:hypothetical protein